MKDDAPAPQDAQALRDAMRKLYDLILTGAVSRQALVDQWTECMAALTQSAPQASPAGLTEARKYVVRCLDGLSMEDAKSVAAVERVLAEIDAAPLQAEPEASGNAESADYGELLCRLMEDNALGRATDSMDAKLLDEWQVACDRYIDSTARATTATPAAREAESGEALDAARWRFFEEHAQSEWNGRRVADWLGFDGVMRYGSRKDAIGAAMAASQTQPQAKGEGA